RPDPQFPLRGLPIGARVEQSHDADLTSDCHERRTPNAVAMPKSPESKHHPDAATVGQLKATGYRFLPVKDELRKNLITKLRAGDELFPGIRGYRETVVPQIVNGILAKHDLLFLGLRGQAKTRILRMLPTLLDEWIPVLAGLDVNDDPLVPMTQSGRRLLSEHGDDTPIEWVHRDQRYQEK